MLLLAQSLITTSLMLQLGVGGIFAIMILRLVFDFIDRRENKRLGSNGIPPSWAVEPIKKIATVAADVSISRTKLKDLHVWHAPEEGVQEWKNKQLVEQMAEFKLALEGCTARSATAIDNNTRVIERIIPILQGLET